MEEMKKNLELWLNTENKWYSRMVGERVTNGVILLMVSVLVSFLLVLGAAQMGEEALS